MGAPEGLSRIRESGLIVVIRGLEPDLAIRTAQVLYEEGVRVLEVTLDSPGATRTISALAERLQPEVLVGAGTVLDAAGASEAVRAGAQFLFAPNLNPRVVETANLYGRIAIPGVMTPTEMVQAVQAGAAAVKVFPANVLGPEYIKQVRAPLPHIPIIPTGGIGEGNIEEYIKAGAFAVGVGGSLLGDDPRHGRFDAVKERAARLMKRLREARAKVSAGQ